MNEWYKTFYQIQGRESELNEENNSGNRLADGSGNLDSLKMVINTGSGKISGGEVTRVKNTAIRTLFVCGSSSKSLILH
jgi:hypothetical protein